MTAENTVITVYPDAGTVSVYAVPAVKSESSAPA